MTVRTLTVERFSVTSVAPFESVLARIDAAIGHPDIRTFLAELAQTRSLEDLEQLVARAIGPSGLMEFVRFDLGEVLRKERGGASPKIVRLVIGNPIIMKQMTQHVPDAASYAPVTILIDERQDGVRLSYDRIGSYLLPYHSVDALKVARALDEKIERLLVAAAA